VNFFDITTSFKEEDFGVLGDLDEIYVGRNRGYFLNIFKSYFQTLKKQIYKALRVLGVTQQMHDYQIRLTNVTHLVSLAKKATLYYQTHNNEVKENIITLGQKGAKISKEIKDLKRKFREGKSSSSKQRAQR